MKQYSADLLTTFNTIPNSCIYALINDFDGTCLVSHSNNLKSRIGQILESNENVRLVVLEESDDLERKLLLCEIYKVKYSSIYKIINPRSYINYKVRIQWDRFLNNVFVVLYNKRRDKRIVGRFDDIESARAFVEQYYSGSTNKVITPVYGIGDNRYINK